MSVFLNIMKANNDIGENNSFCIVSLKSTNILYLPIALYRYHHSAANGTKKSSVRFAVNVSYFLIRCLMDSPDMESFT